MKARALEYSKWYSLQRKFGMTKTDYEGLLQKQNHVCAICQGTSTRALAVDHCHNTGKIRGLLCTNCNRGLGYLKDSAELLRKAANYIDNYRS